MGGHLIKNAKRMSLEVHNRIFKEVFDALSKTFPNLPIAGTKALRDKKDFGDIDIIVGVDGLGSWPIETLKDFLKEHQVSQSSLNAKVGYENNDPLHGRVILKQNRGVFSFAWPDGDGQVQIDLILVPDVFFKVAQDYLSWSGIGNLLGRSLSKMGFKMGIEGLQYFFSHPALRNHRSILITEKMDEVLDFLGYDPKRYDAGFNHAQETFEYVITSPWFDPNLYLPQNRPHDQRVRDEKHPLHVAFLEWMADKGILKQSGLTWPSPEFFLQEAQNRWPNFASRLLEVQQEVQQLLDKKPPFDGHWIQENLGIYGVELGKVLKKSQELWGKEKTFREAWENGDLEKRIELFKALMIKEASLTQGVEDALTHHKKEGKKLKNG